MDLVDLTGLVISEWPPSTIKASYVHVLDHNDPGKHLTLIQGGDVAILNTTYRHF
jgi:hypothetical protein